MHMCVRHKRLLALVSNPHLQELKKFQKYLTFGNID